MRQNFSGSVIWSTLTRISVPVWPTPSQFYLALDLQEYSLPAMQPIFRFKWKWLSTRSTHLNVTNFVLEWINAVPFIRMVVISSNTPDISRAIPWLLPEDCGSGNLWCGEKVTQMRCPFYFICGVQILQHWADQIETKNIILTFTILALSWT